jgi:hypothetical protein
MLAARRVQGKKTAFRSRASGVLALSETDSLPSEQDSFLVEREVSVYGDNDIHDHVSRKRILEGMIREYIANFGTGPRAFGNQIAGLIFLSSEDPNAMWK